MRSLLPAGVRGSQTYEATGDESTDVAQTRFEQPPAVSREPVEN